MSTTNPTWTTTEWDDILIKKGIIEAPELEVTEVELNRAAQDIAEIVQPLVDKDIAELDQIAEEEDGNDDDLETLRRKRMLEMMKFAKTAKFGTVIHVTKTAFVQEVTEASKTAPVVCHLYTEARVECILLNEIFVQLAKAHRDVKFCKAVASDVMENFPESKCPTLLIYKDGQCANQIIGCDSYKELTTRRMTLGAVEFALVDAGLLAGAELTEEDPRKAAGVGKKDIFGYSAAKLYGARERTDRDADRSDDEEKDDREFSRLGKFGSAARRERENGTRVGGAAARRGGFDEEDDEDEEEW